MLFSNKQANNQIDGNKALNNPKILEVNLIKEESRLEFNWKKNIWGLIFALVVTLFIVFEIYLGLDWWQQDEELRLEQTKADVSRTSKEVAAFRESASDVLSFKDKTIEVGRLLDEHVYWTNLFSWLEKNTLSTVSFASFSGRDDGKYALAGTAGSFAEVAWQVKQFTDDPFVIDAEVMTVTAADSDVRRRAVAAVVSGENNEGDENNTSELSVGPAVSFNLELELDPAIFRK